MEGTIVGKPPTCQELAECTLTDDISRVPIALMGINARAIGERLRRTRLALGFESKVEFCNQIDVDKGSLTHWEKGERPLTLRAAIKIKDRWGIPLDWLFCGDKAQLSAELYDKILRIRHAA